MHFTALRSGATGSRWWRSWPSGSLARGPAALKSPFSVKLRRLALPPLIRDPPDVPFYLHRPHGVLATGQHLSRRFQRVERIGDHGTGVPGVDDRVHESPFGGLPRGQEPLGVVGPQRFLILGTRPPVQDLHRPFGAHHRDLGTRPGKAQVVPESL